MGVYSYKNNSNFGDPSNFDTFIDTKDTKILDNIFDSIKSNDYNVFMNYIAKFIVIYSHV